MNVLVKCAECGTRFAIEVDDPVHIEDLQEQNWYCAVSCWLKPINTGVQLS